MDGQLESSSVTAPVAAGQGDTGQLATGQPGDIVQPAPGPGEPSPLAPETAPAPDDKGPVPYERFAEVNRKVREAEDRANRVEQMLQQSMQAWQQQQVQRPSQPPQADPIAEYIKREGIGKDGFVSSEDLVKTVAFVRENSQRELQQTLETRQRNEWLASHPDYVGVVTTPTGQASEFLNRAIQKNPALGMSLQRNFDPIVAYEIARAEQERSTRTAPVTPAPAPVPAPNMVQQIRAAQRAPQSISAATGPGQLDHASQVQSMTDEQFAVYLANLKARA